MDLQHTFEPAEGVYRHTNSFLPETSHAQPDSSILTLAWRLPNIKSTQNVIL